jgi:hypothetical protein
MHPKRVLIVNVRSLLMESVAGLVDSGGNGQFDVVSTLANNLPDLLNEVEELRPKVLVIDRATSFIKPEEMLVFLLYIAQIRLIVLDSGTNKMDIFDKQELLISHPNQFIEALDFERASSSPRRLYVANENQEQDSV